MTPSSSMTPAASASSWTSRAANRTPSSSKASRSSRTSTIAAPAAARSTPATAPACCMQMPHAFLKKVAKKDARINLPEPGLYAAGNIFMPRNATQRRKIEEVFARVVQAEGQVYLGARSVPTDNSMLGETAKALRAVRAPGVHRPRPGDARRGGVRAQALRDPQARVQRDPRVDHRRRGVLVHRVAVAQDAGLQGHADDDQLDQYFLDLQNPLMETAIALVHSRFSTNTFPSWDRAHPYRCIAHNGEINTLRGNINWMRAREALFQSPVFGEDIKKITPIINPNGSDSSMFDNVLELMVLSGRSMPHAVMMMIPEPWSKHASMDPARRAFYQYHSSLMEPWDGPADIAFTDGKRIGAVLDRNGLAPGPLLRHQGRPRRHGVRSRRARVPARAHRAQGPAAAGPHVPRGHRARPHRRRRGDQGADHQRAAVRRLAEAAPGAPQGSARGAGAAAAGARGARQAPGVVRLHVRRPAHSHGADGARWQRRRGLHGQRHAAGRALAEVAHVVRLLQAAVRAGHEPAHRLHPRRDHHLVGRVAGLGRQLARPAPRRLPPARAAGPGAHQRRIRQGAAHVAARPQGGHAAHPVPRRARRRRPGRRPSRRCAPKPSA